MAEQEYPIEPLGLETSAANDELAALDNEPTELLSQARLEARYLDTNLFAANEAEFVESAVLSAYPVDAFFRACQRHLRFGPSDTTAMDPETELVQDAALPEEAPTTVPRASTTNPRRRKGPSYAL